jgi:hypothetical protein
MATKAVEKVSEAVSEFFKWLTNWNKTSASRNDKKSIKIGKRLSFIVLEIKGDDHKKARELANDFLKSLD